MKTLAIVGAGFGGTLVAVHLLERHAPPGARVLLFERSGRFARGVAYGTRHPDHRLNVPAGSMSAFEDRPDDFLGWAALREPDATARCFLPRRLYGMYLGDLLDAAERAGAARGVELVRRAEAVRGIAASRGGFAVASAQGGAEAADAVVLALGNLPPAPAERFPEAAAAGPRWVADPWAPDALAIPPEEAVLLLGTGLTMLDAVVALAAAGHRGPLVAVSRRGVVSHAHRAALPGPPPRVRPADLDAWPRTARGLLRALREEVRASRARGVDWREVVASLRADTPALWRSLSLAEQRRFLARLRPYWDAHRHRSAPETALAVDALRARRQLAVLAGRVEGVVPEADALAVTLRLRGGAARVLRVGRVVDCTGAAGDLARSADPLLRGLFGAGLARPDALGLGLACDDDGFLFDHSGRVARRLATLGTLRRGQLWETTAVPELRVQAERLAAQLGARVREA